MSRPHAAAIIEDAFNEQVERVLRGRGWGNRVITHVGYGTSTASGCSHGSCSAAAAMLDHPSVRTRPGPLPPALQPGLASLRHRSGGWGARGRHHRRPRGLRPVRPGRLHRRGGPRPRPRAGVAPGRRRGAGHRPGARRRLHRRRRRPLRHRERHRRHRHHDDAAAANDRGVEHLRPQRQDAARRVRDGADVPPTSPRTRVRPSSICRPVPGTPSRR